MKFCSLKYLGIDGKLIYHTIKLYNETETIKDRSRSSRPRSATVANKTVKERIRRNPARHQKCMAPSYLYLNYYLT